QILTAIPLLSSLYAAPTNDERYKTLNRYRVQLRRFDALVFDRLKKVHMLSRHSQGEKKENYLKIESVLHLSIRITPIWITAVNLLYKENTEIVLRGGEWAVKRARKRTLRRAKMILAPDKEVSR
ncbi:MAG: hypothetical protein Q9168_003470, partial [Polycauliona sp. 1 TL-2023]